MAIICKGCRGDSGETGAAAVLSAVEKSMASHLVELASWKCPHCGEKAYVDIEVDVFIHVELAP